MDYIHANHYIVPESAVWELMYFGKSCADEKFRANKIKTKEKRNMGLKEFFEDKKRVVNDPEVVLSLEKVEKLIDGKGRVLLRESGTEPVIRIMVESETVELCEKYADIIASIIKERGHLSE